MSGTRQLMEVMTNSFPRPIPSAMESNRLVSSSGTCENCHSTQKFASAKLRVIPDYAADESNTPSQTVLTMLVGGSKFPGIHGSHFGPESQSDMPRRIRNAKRFHGWSTRTEIPAPSGFIQRRIRTLRISRICRNMRCSVSTATIGLRTHLSYQSAQSIGRCSSAAFPSLCPLLKRRVLKRSRWNTKPVMRRRAGYRNSSNLFTRRLIPLCRRAGRRT